MACSSCNVSCTCRWTWGWDFLVNIDTLEATLVYYASLIDFAFTTSFLFVAFLTQG